MNRDRIRTLLDQVRSGEIDTEHALESLARLPFSDVPSARVDTHRALRIGIPEVIYAPGKTPEQIVEIVRSLREAGQDVLATRVSADTAARVQGACGRVRVHTASGISAGLRGLRISLWPHAASAKNAPSPGSWHGASSFNKLRHLYLSAFKFNTSFIDFENGVIVAGLSGRRRHFMWTHWSLQTVCRFCF